jgi:ATP-dependent RNA helicase RhlE
MPGPGKECLNLSFDSLGLMPELLRAVAEEGYTEPTPVQQQAIPVIIAGRDVMAGAQTGTGKTAGFTLPLLQRLAPHANTSVSPARHPVRCLVLTPTRELAAQVEESVRVYGKYIKGLRTTVIYGGVPMDPQTKALRDGVEILVATPGRLLDHVQQRNVTLGQVEALVLDEADRMLDMGFMPDLRRILALLPQQRQNLLFSATFSDEIKRLSTTILRDPVRIEVARKDVAADTVRQAIVSVPRDDKRSALVALLRARPTETVLVFTRTKQEAGRLARHLEKEGVNSAAIHGDKTQPERTQALADFKSGKVRVLVATDVAARGLDIDDLPLVINFELPHVAEDYVHRIGRTGRAGRSGEALSLASPDENDLVAAIEKLLKRPIPRETLGSLGAAAVPDARAGGPARRERSPRREAPPVERDEAPPVDEPRVPRESHRPPRAVVRFVPSGRRTARQVSAVERAPGGRPSRAETQEAVVAPVVATRRPRPVAALLGGMKKNGR